MNISFFANSGQSIRLAQLLKRSDIGIKGVFDFSIQKSVEFAAYADCIAYTGISEALDDSDIIFLTDNKNTKAYLSAINQEASSNKILCLITSKTTSDKIYTNEFNTHFSIYSPYLFSSKKEKNPSAHLYTEGFGIRHNEFIDYLTSLQLDFSEISVDKAVQFYSAINLFTSGTEALIKVSEKLLSEITPDSHDVLREILCAVNNDCIEPGPFFTNDTYNVIKTIDSIKSFNRPAVLSLYKILGLNAVDCASYNKEDKEHFINILLDNQK